MSNILKTFTNFIKNMSERGVKLKDEGKQTIGELVRADNEFIDAAVKTDPDLTSDVYAELNETSLEEIAKEIVPEAENSNYTQKQQEQIENSVLSGLIAGISHVVLNDAIRQLPLVNAEDLSNAIPRSRGMSMGSLINNIMLSQSEVFKKSPRESTKINTANLSQDIDELAVDIAVKCDSNRLMQSTMFTNMRVATTGIVIGALGATLHHVFNKVLPTTELEKMPQQVA